MKKNLSISYYRLVCALSVFCLLFPLIITLLHVRAAPVAATLAAGLLSGSAVLLLLPLGEERGDLSFRFALGMALICCGGVLFRLPVRLWLWSVLLTHLAALVCRSSEQYAQLRPLFRHITVWYNVENQARWMYSLILFLLAGSVPCGASGLALWLPALADLAFYVLLWFRVWSGRTLFVGARKEQAIKDLIKGNLRTVPPQSDDSSEDMSQMSRVYDRVVSLMEDKHMFLDEDLSLNDLSAAAFTNKSYLSKTVNIISGRNVSQFVNYYRIQYSLELIRKDPYLKVVSLALMSGFHSAVTFTSAFKLNVGENPSDYMERVRRERREGEKPG